MPQDYVYVVRSAPVKGLEDEYNRWYTEQHLQDVLAVPGFVSAQRFTLKTDDPNEVPYLALYYMRTDDPDALLAKLVELVESGKMAMTEAFDHERVATVLYQAITPSVQPIKA